MGKLDPRMMKRKEREELEWTLLRALHRLGLGEKQQRLLRGIFTESEAVMLARRVKIAEALMKGKTFEEIEDELHVGLATIRFVDRWLGEDLEQLQSIIASLGKDRAEKRRRSLKKSTYWEIDPLSFDGLRARYPQYFPLLNFLLGDPREKYEHKE